MSNSGENFAPVSKISQWSAVWTAAAKPCPTSNRVRVNRAVWGLSRSVKTIGINMTRDSHREGVPRGARPIKRAGTANMSCHKEACPWLSEEVGKSAMTVNSDSYTLRIRSTEINIIWAANGEKNRITIANRDNGTTTMLMIGT